MRVWLVPLLLVSVLSGCLSEPDAPEATEGPSPMALSYDEVVARLTAPVFDVVVREEVVVEGADGVDIWLDVYRPGDAEEPVPVILVKTPYQSTRTATAPLAMAAGYCTPGHPDECPYNVFLVDYFVPRGYAVAFADVRGNHNSGGCIDQSGPKQWQDGYNVVEWLGAQEWSNGRVGMYGASYDGESQVSTALLDPPSLVTIVPTASVSNQYGYSFYDGVPFETGAVGTSAAYLGISLVPGAHPTALTTYHERLLCQAEVWEAAADMSGDWSTYWEERDYRPGAPNISASVLQTHGLQDWNVKPDHLDGFFNELTSEKRLIIGQWGHNYPQREDWTFILHRWFDHYLHGIDTGILEDLPPVLVEDSEGRFRGIDSFPPLEQDTVTFWPTDGGKLRADPADASKMVVHDHPRQAGALPLPLTGEGQEAATGHPSRLLFESESLDEDLHYTGRPLVHLFAETDQERTRWVVHLVQVAPDGTETIINRGYLNTRHIDGVDRPGTLTPGEPYNVTVRMFPQDDVIPAGSRIRLVVTNADPWVQQDTTYAMSQISVGANETRLEIPLAPVGKAVPEDALRETLRAP